MPICNLGRRIVQAWLATHRDYYIGVGLCSHSIERMEQATFSDIEQADAGKNRRSLMISTLEVLKPSAPTSTAR